jgi:hypothetical protein
LLCQFLLINKDIYPNDTFSLDLTSYAAFPDDQSLRIPESIAQKLDEYSPEHSAVDLTKKKFGETDIVTIFCLRNKQTGQTLTLGTLSLEQTTTSMRSWAELPKGAYNINGRLHCSDIEVQLSTVFSLNARVTKIPANDRQEPTDLRTRNFARIISRANASLLRGEDFYAERTLERPYENSFSYSAETDIFNDWLSGRPTKSDLASHMTTMAVLQKLAEGIHTPGRTLTLDFPYEFNSSAQPKPDLPPTKDGPGFN